MKGLLILDNVEMMLRFRVSMLFNLHSMMALCFLRLGIAGPGALGPGQRSAAFLLR